MSNATSAIPSDLKNLIPYFQTIATIKGFAANETDIVHFNSNFNSNCGSSADLESKTVQQLSKYPQTGYSLNWYFINHFEQDLNYNPSDKNNRASSNDATTAKYNLLASYLGFQELPKNSAD